MALSSNKSSMRSHQMSQKCILLMTMVNFESYCTHALYKNIFKNVGPVIGFKNKAYVFDEDINQLNQVTVQFGVLSGGLQVAISIQFSASFQSMFFYVVFLCCCCMIFTEVHYYTSKTVVLTHVGYFTNEPD